MQGDTERDSAVLYWISCSLWRIALQEMSETIRKSPDYSNENNQGSRKQKFERRHYKVFKQKRATTKRKGTISSLYPCRKGQEIIGKKLQQESVTERHF